MLKERKEELVRIDTAQVLKNPEGKAMTMVSSEIVNGVRKMSQTLMVFRDAVTNLLNTEDQANKLSNEKKNQAWQIIKKLWKKKEVDLTIDDMALIKERAIIFWSPVAYGILSELFEAGKKKDEGV